MSVKHGLLALVASRPRYGYELKKEFEEATGELWPLNVGQVYTTLGRLVRDGLVSEEGGGEGGDAESQRRYRITPAGADELEDWFAQPRPAGVGERDELVIKIALAVRDRPSEAEGIIQRQRAETTAALQAMTRRKARLGPDDLSQSVVLDAAVSRLDGELRWLDLVSARLAGSTRPGSKQNRTKR